MLKITFALVAAAASALLTSNHSHSQIFSRKYYSSYTKLENAKREFKASIGRRPRLPRNYKKLAFEDDFNVLSVADASEPATAAKWFTPGHTTYGWATFLTLTASPETYTIQDGMLRLRMYEADGKWRGATIASVNEKDQGFTLSKGYVEVRLKVAQQIGGWSAFWMTSLDSPTTGMHGEIDVVESYGATEYGYNSAIHLWPGRHPPAGASQSHWAAGVYPRTPVASDGQFHTYGCELTDKWIVYYQDGFETSRVARSAEWNDAPFRLFLSLAGGPNQAKAKAVGPIDMWVDSIRVWTP